MSKPVEIGRRVGFDFGDKRIGVATSDRESILVSPHATILNNEKLVDKLLEIVKEKTINSDKKKLQKVVNKNLFL